jgi:hypothetical protein
MNTGKFIVDLRDKTSWSQPTLLQKVACPES